MYFTKIIQKTPKLEGTLLTRCMLMSVALANGITDDTQYAWQIIKRDLSNNMDLIESNELVQINDRRSIIISSDTVELQIWYTP